MTFAIIKFYSEWPGPSLALARAADYNEEDINMFWGRGAGVQQPGEKRRAESFAAHLDFPSRFLSQSGT